MSEYNLTREQRKMRVFSLGDSLVREIEEWMLSQHSKRGPSLRYLVLSESHKAWSCILHMIQSVGGDAEIIQECRERFSLFPTAIPVLSNLLSKAAWYLNCVLEQVEDLHETLEEVMSNLIGSLETVWEMEGRGYYE